MKHALLVRHGHIGIELVSQLLRTFYRPCKTTAAAVPFSGTGIDDLVFLHFVSPVKCGYASCVSASGPGDFSGPDGGAHVAWPPSSINHWQGQGQTGSRTRIFSGVVSEKSERVRI